MRTSTFMGFVAPMRVMVFSSRARRSTLCISTGISPISSRKSVPPSASSNFPLAPVRLAPVKENRNNCPFLTGDRCAIHDAEPLVCALYPLAQEISRKGQVSYFLQPTGCGGQVIEARVEDYLARYDVPAREQTDVRWAQTCMTLEDTVEQLGAQLSPVLVRRMQDKLWQALYFGYNYAAPFLPQLEKNLHWLDAEFAKLAEYQQKRNNASK